MIRETLPSSEARGRGPPCLPRLVLLLLLTIGAPVLGQINPLAAPPLIAGRPARILVRPLPGKSLAALHQAYGLRRLRVFPGLGGLEILEVPPGANVDALVAAYQHSGLVRYAEPDHIVHADLEPNDPYFLNGTCWPLMNTGVSGGIAGADIDATDAWNTISSAANIIVAVVDSGIRYTHQDLSPNMWHNPGEIPGNGKDDDGDGYVDDVYGINAITGSGDPSDDYGHGSHVAGIIGAKGFNGAGVVGVCWSVQLMACKFIDSAGNGSVSDAITCIDYARSKGAKVINFSWGDSTWNSPALYDAIQAAGNAGIIFTVACGNTGANNDITPDYPSDFPLDNIISVAVTTRRDELASYSCYGPTTVDLGAPGDTVYSCWNSSDSSYRYLSGTSMAAPLVAGACALLEAEYPNESYADIIHRILWNVTPLPELAGKCVSGGRLNLAAAMRAPPPTSPPTVTVSASDPTATIGTSDTGAFTFARTGDTSAALTVNYQLGGTAIQWDDYRRPQGDMPVSITIPAGTNSTPMTIEAMGNETGANPETVALTLSSDPTYVVGSPNNATITIYPNTPLVIQSLRFSAPGHVTLTWPSIPGGSYQVQSTGSLTGAGWQNASGIITASGSSTSWTGNASGAGPQFYQVIRIN